MPSEEYGVLVARAVPLSKPAAAADSQQNVKVAKQWAKGGGVDSLSDSLNALQISKVVAAIAANAQSATGPDAPTPAAAKKQLQQRRSDAAISPADFVNLQSMRSSALARKTNTTSKFNRDCRNLFADLLAPSGGAAAAECVADVEKNAKPQKPKVEKSNVNASNNNKNKNNNNNTPTRKESAEKKCSPVGTDDSKESTPRPLSDDKEAMSANEDASPKKEAARKGNAEEADGTEDEKTADDLLSRGPIRMGRTPTSGGYHPYDANTTTPPANNDYGSPAAMPYGAAPQSAVNDPSSYSTNAYTYGYDCGAQSGWLNAGGGGGCFADSRESTPDTVSSDLGYASAASPRFAVHAAGYGGSQCGMAAGGYLTGGVGRPAVELDDLCSTLRESDLTLLNNNNNSNNNNNANNNIQNGRGNNNTFVDNMQNSIGYTTGVSSPFSTSSTSSASPPSIAQHAASYYEHSATPGGGGGFNSEAITSELPDALSDFILKYSRRYTPPDADVSGAEYGGAGDGSVPQLAPHKQQCQQQQQRINTGAYYGAGGSSASSSPLSGYSTGYGSGVESSFSSPKTANGDSQCNSPLGATAGCLPPKGSPAAPRGGCGEHASPPLAVTATAAAATGGEAVAQLLYSQQTRHAKERLRALIANDDMDKAWAWTLKCIKNYPGALCFQDSDGDTLLHIVTHHQDLAKIYALVEQLLKMELEGAAEGNGTQKKWFNAPNRCGETPLHLAVQHRQPAVVDYLLEAGASANTHNGRPERDAPLHYAAARGMRQMVETICGHSQTNVNLTNGMGLTALLYAVKNHGVVDEEQPQQPVDNCGVVEALLRHHADPLVADPTSGKTVIHYAVERLEVKLIEVFRANLPPHLMSALVNQRDLSGETPLHVLEEVSATAAEAASPQPSAAAAAPSSVTAESSSSAADVAQLRSRIYCALVACGAESAP